MKKKESRLPSGKLPPNATKAEVAEMQRKGHEIMARMASVDPSPVGKVEPAPASPTTPWLACCPQAVATSCVCVAAYNCPVHGPMHVGSHD